MRAARSASAARTGELGAFVVAMAGPPRRTRHAASSTVDSERKAAVSTLSRPWRRGSDPVGRGPVVVADADGESGTGAGGAPRHAERRVGGRHPVHHPLE